MNGITAVYIAAGLSSRFGGKIKGLVPVGEFNEPLIHVSIQQAKEAGVKQLVFVVSDKTFESYKALLGEEYLGLPVRYAFQQMRPHRKKPFGTVEAVLAAQHMVTGPFIMLNADDLYGVPTLRSIVAHLEEGNGHCVASYALKNVVPKEGKVNRGLIQHDNWNVTGVEEQYDVNAKDIGVSYTGDEPISMNLFGFYPEIFTFLDKKLKAFLMLYEHHPSKEFILVDALHDHHLRTGIHLRAIPTTDGILGVTNPGDEAMVKQALLLQSTVKSSLS